MKEQIKIEYVLIAAVIVCALAAWALVVRPVTAETTELQDEAAELQLAIEAQRLAREDVGLEDLPELDYGYGFDLTRALPDQHDVPRVLLELDAISAAAGVEFDSLQPGEPLGEDSTNALPVAVTFSGTYGGLRDSLEAIREVTRVRNGIVRSRGRLYTVDGFDFAEAEDGFPAVEASIQINAHALGAAPGSDGAAAATDDDAEDDEGDDASDESTDDSSDEDSP